MNVLLDTHTWAWTLSNNREKLSAEAVAAISEAEAVFVSPISVFEIGQKAKAGKWPEMLPFVDRLPALVHEQQALFASLTPEICLSATGLSWEHRDPFDRMLAATAIENRLTYVSVDTAFDALAGVEGWIGRLW